MMSKLFDGSRRRFIQIGLATLGCTLAKPALALLPDRKGMKELALHNLHTDERLQVMFCKDGKYNRTALEKINHVLRDHRSGDVYPMHPKLLDLICELQCKLGNHNAIEIISGYRSPRTNAKMASYSKGVANRSYHTKGMAIDIRLPGTPLSTLHQTALSLRRGGVGYYPSSGFVHVDIGPVRRW